MSSSKLCSIFFYVCLQKSTRNPYVDIFVAIITVPTLILLALLLDANIQDNLDTTTETRSSFIVLIFGFSFLVLSSLICGCIVHKMGMCRWDRRRFEEEINRSNRSSSIGSVHIIDLPPTYDTVVKQEIHPQVDSSLRQPPPTYEMACNIEKLAQNNAIGAVHHI